MIAPAMYRSFKDTVKAELDRDPAFRDALLAETIECFFNGELGTGQAMLRDFFTATMRQQVQEALDNPEPSLTHDQVFAR